MIKMAYVFFCAALLVGQTAHADLQSLWPDKVDALVLSESQRLEVDNINKARYTYQRKVLIFNNAGNDYAKMLVSQSQFIKTSAIKAHIETAGGEVIRKLKKDDIESFHYSPGHILYNDATYDYFDLSYSSYPYVFEVEYTQDIKSLFFWPDWFPQEDIPVMMASYQLVINPDVAYKTHVVNVDVEPIVEETGKRRTLTWTLNAIKPVEDESYMPPEHRLQKAIIFAPVEFSLGRYKGSFESWDTYAQWYRDLTADVFGLDNEAIARVKNVVSTSNGEREIVENLYAFLQQYTRYVAIEPGLSGWQPHTSQSVFDNRYGDCKDLTSLMISMLDIAGIKAYPAMVKTRDHGLLFSDFPSNQFNHVIAVVPLASDTIWLECTADLMPSNFVPDTYEGCDVFVIKDKTGEIWRTPQSHATDNGWTGLVQGVLRPSGDLEFSSFFKATGNQGDYFRSALYAKDRHDEKLWLEQFAGRYQPSISMERYTLCNIADNLGFPVQMDLSGIVPKFAKRSVDRLFFNPNVMTRKSGDSIPDEEERLFPIYYKYAYMDSDTLRLELPAGYELEAAPDTMTLQTDFATFSTAFKIEGQSMQYVRTICILSPLIPVEAFENFREFIKNVVKSDRSQFVLKKTS